MSAIDWTVFDRFPESTCHCYCGTTFRSHAKVVVRGEGLATLTRKPCPSCNCDDRTRWISDDPEGITL